MDVAYIRWQRASSRVVLQILYETFSAHGIRTHPPQEDALSGWDQLHRSRITTPTPEEEPGQCAAAAPPPKKRPKRLEEEEDGLLVVPHHQHRFSALISGQFVIQEVDSLQELVDVGDAEPVFSHLWVVVNVCRFPMDTLQQCHAALSMDMRERLARVPPVGGSGEAQPRPPSPRPWSVRTVSAEPPPHCCCGIVHPHGRSLLCLPP